MHCSNNSMEKKTRIDPWTFKEHIKRPIPKFITIRRRNNSATAFATSVVTVVVVVLLIQAQKITFGRPLPVCHAFKIFTSHYRIF